MELVKTVSSSGQISLGRKFAGRTVMLSEYEQGVWILKLGNFIPDNEKWLHTAEVQVELDEAIDWAEKNPPEETDLKQLGDRINAI